MSVYKPAKSRFYHYDFQHQGRRFSGSTGCETQRKAEAVERKIRQDAALGRLDAPAANTYTLDEAAGRWWDEVGVRRKDAAKLKPRAHQLLTLFKAGVTLAEIDTALVAEAIERRRGRRYRRSPHRDAKLYFPGNATVNRDVIETLRPILSRAETHWGATGLPRIGWRDLRLQEPREIVRTYSPAERAAWLSECDDVARLALDLLLTYGLRFGELFFPLAVFEPDGPRLRWMKGRKGDVPHRLPLLDRHAREIAARIGRAQAAGHLTHIWFVEEIDAEAKRRAGPAVTRLRALTYGGLEARLSSAADRARIAPGRRIHGARHHAGTAILKATGSLKVAQQLLGHADIASTARYAHALEDDVRDGLDAIEAADVARDGGRTETKEKTA